MEITDIIKTYTDRLFMVDHECFIIFTGDSLDDEKPFIRIGNWINMPVDLIPFVENIIITDGLIGDPSLEQFNIDIRFLKANRYIGSSQTVKRYLDFQKMFGLDLRNATVVDIEKDLPTLADSRERTISKKDQFIGVFYRDGNYKTLYNGKTIIDLLEIEKETVNYQKAHQLLAQAYKNAPRYAGAGVVIAEHTPFFYSRGNFLPYLFPQNYFSDFAQLGIDPDRIRDILFPSSNVLALPKILKWKNSKRGSVRLFTDHQTHVELLKKLFTNCNITREPWDGVSMATDYGLSFYNYPGTYSLRLVFSRVQPGAEDCTIAYIKGIAGIKEILKDESLDCIFITYSAYEDTTLLFKSSDIPVVIVDDGNANVNRLKDRALVVLRPGTQYEFAGCADAHRLFSLAQGAGKIVTPDMSDTTACRSALEPLLADAPASPGARVALRNIASLLQFHVNTTSNRRFSREIQELNEQVMAACGDLLFNAREAGLQVLLVFHEKNVYPFLMPATTAPADAPLSLRDDIVAGADATGEIAAFHERVIEDRRRLELLLSLYREGSRFYADNAGEIGLLKEAITERREQFDPNRIRTDNLVQEIELAAELAARGEAARNRPGAIAFFSRLSRPAKIGFLLLPLLLLAAVLALVHFLPAGCDRDANEAARNAKARQEAPDNESITRNVHSKKIEEKRAYLDRLNGTVAIRPSDIWHYANQVALKNGYREITYNALRSRNPNWIYPTNVFVMLDGEKITVQDGDTLWELSRLKLVEMSIKFDRTIAQLAKAGNDARRSALLAEARNYAFSREHAAILAQSGKVGASGTEKR